MANQLAPPLGYFAQLQGFGQPRLALDEFRGQRAGVFGGSLRKEI